MPVIGPDEMAVGRDMHWLRVDRYVSEGTAGFQPVPCMHCEKAPCEPVCPVEASVHDSQGLNLQVYNRCVGTRTCEANCPYKVRRFNFLDYAERSVWGMRRMSPSPRSVIRTSPCGRAASWRSAPIAYNGSRPSITPPLQGRRPLRW
ncbi:4Fe-4S dicluster domain-containing protein [Novosphingobium panipatense]|uniref:4Fe-4S dicluster domain-containing protein n=1 Tax=Novosphingobium panipatense TaxID=428991 RepID=UPI0036217E37